MLFSSSSYICPDHKYTLFCIGRRMELNISHILFQNLKTSIVESRDEERAKCPYLPRNTIPFARMILDILIESDLLDSIRTTRASQFLRVVQGPVFNGVDLFRLDLIKEVTSVGTSFPDILSRRVPVAGFATLFQAELRKAVKHYLEASVRTQSSVDPAWIRGRVLPSLADLQKKDQKKQEARLKRKAQEDEAKKAKKQRVTYDPDKVNTPEYQQQRIRESLRASRTAKVSRHIFTPPS